jgi:DNA replication protein DnaC
MKNIGARYALAKLEDVQENIRERFKNIEKTRKGLFIFGPVGSGKTHTACALYKNARLKIQKKTTWGEETEVIVEPIFWNVSELFHELRSDFDRQQGQKMHIEDQIMQHKGILFLDDIGSEKVSDWVLETFYLIINSRYNEMSPIIFTSNFNIGEIATRLGERIASRIVESCDIFRLDGDDRRLGASRNAS